uniref:Uncharacterized protein n=1 Tax=Chromera velia TaxID=505693 RepID=D9IXH9_9ALVE|nr:hypothetical protein CHVEC_pgp069 [Chromera velia]ADJ66507.1 hypothetical protein [Chromera velia]
MGKNTRLLLRPPIPPKKDDPYREGNSPVLFNKQGLNLCDFQSDLEEASSILDTSSLRLTNAERLSTLEILRDMEITLEFMQEMHNQIKARYAGRYYYPPPGKEDMISTFFASVPNVWEDTGTPNRGLEPLHGDHVVPRKLAAANDALRSHRISTLNLLLDITYGPCVVSYRPHLW